MGSYDARPSGMDMNAGNLLASAAWLVAAHAQNARTVRWGQAMKKNFMKVMKAQQSG